MKLFVPLIKFNNRNKFMITKCIFDEKNIRSFFVVEFKIYFEVLLPNFTNIF